MRRMTCALAAAAVLAAGCGKDEPKKSTDELNAMQAKDQQQADDDERAMRKEQKKKK